MADNDQPPEYPAVMSDDEEEPELSFDNPLVVRIRDALRKQLEGVNEKITADLRLQTEAVSRILKRREDVGVELYGVQQQLAKLQNAVEKAHDTFSIAVQVREQSEERKSTILSELSSKSHQLGEQKVRVTKLQGELDKLNVTLKQVEKYNEEMKGEIALNRRATYKAEELVQGMERSKRQQDYELEELNAFILDLQKQLNLYTSQLEAQQKETASAAATLEEAAREMDLIRTEKKALLQKWRSSLLQIERCDEQLTATEFATRQWKEKELAIDGEITSFRKSIKNEQEKNELLVGQVTKVRSEAGYLEKQIDVCMSEHAQLTEQFNLFKLSLEKAEAELKEADTAKKSVLDEQVKVEKNVVRMAQEVQKLEDDISAALNDQTTLQKSQNNVKKSTVSVTKDIHAKENEIAQVANELARIKVDSLNTTAHNAQLKATHLEVEEELHRKEALIAKYEQEIRRRTDELEKKMRDLDTLNRRFEVLKAKFSDQAGEAEAAVGPLEATIKSLKNNIESVKKENGELQRRWMSSQMELVGLQNEALVANERVDRMRSQHSVLNQKRSRLLGQVQVQEGETRELESGIRQMRTDMARLNDMLAKNGQLSQTLEEDNFTLEAEFINRLKDAEHDITRLQANVAATKAAKVVLEQELIECERQIMLLERKLELEKETQAAYNQEDETGNIIKSMKREIHKMELRHVALLQEQEDLVVEVERCISKRESISMKGKTMPKKSETSADRKKGVNDLKGKIKDLESESQRYKKQILQLEADREDIGQRLDALGVQRKQLQQAEETAQITLNQLELEKDALYRQVLKHQRAVKRFQSLETGKYMAGTMEAIQLAVQKTKQKRDTVVEIARMVAGEEAHASAALNRMIEEVLLM